MIYLDNIVFSLQKSGGISVVWYEHLKRLLNENVYDVKILEYDSAINNHFRKDLIIDNDLLLQKSSKLLKLKRYLNPKFDSGSSPFLFHSSYYRTCRNKNAINITTVHDFTYEYFGKGITKKIHCNQKYKAIQNSDLVICISENTKQDLLRFLPEVNQDKIRVVYNGVSNDYFKLPTSNDDRYKEDPYVLFVGARNWYKNFDLAVEAIAETQLSLKIVGSPLSDSELNFLESKLGKNRYNYAGRVSNSELNMLYNNAYCLLYPSSYEGFGIPVIEAQKAGCPVIAMDCSSITEIVGDKSLLINDKSTNQIVQKLNLLKGPSFREQIISIGLENSRRFSWDNTYRNTMNVYEEAIY